MILQLNFIWVYILDAMYSELTARQEIMNTDGSEKAIKKLAKEAASKAAMQIEE